VIPIEQRSMPTLHDPLTIGDIKLPNRVLMAPLTRCRADNPGRVPTPLMAEYYRQRASAGLILTEATSVDPMGVGYPNTPGIWSDEQVAGWRPITSAVHDAGGRIFLQLWHVGRISDPHYLNGATPVAPSAIAANGFVSGVTPKKPYMVPRALETNELPGIVAAYELGAANAKRAGFDGVEIHGANGYLLDQFLQDSANHRTDAYGGSVENRARLMLEVTDACIDVWGAGKVGMHLAPRADSHSMGDSHRAATFVHVARELGRRKLAFICGRESVGPDWLSPMLRHEFRLSGGGAYIINEALTAETAQAAIDSGAADGAAFGRLFIANPDLPRRLRERAALNDQRPQLFYTPGPEGYTDYPALPSQ